MVLFRWFPAGDFDEDADTPFDETWNVLAAYLGQDGYANDDLTWRLEMHGAEDGSRRLFLTCFDENGKCHPEAITQKHIDAVRQFTKFEGSEWHMTDPDIDIDEGAFLFRFNEGDLDNG